MMSNSFEKLETVTVMGTRVSQRLLCCIHAIVALTVRELKLTLLIISLLISIFNLDLRIRKTWKRQ